MIYDCFLFFDEINVLELRLEELNEVVDRFVLVESTKTFSNRPKPLYFEENKELFRKYATKIRHVVVREMPQHHESAWDVEYFHRNALMRGLEDATSDDLIIISDVDEIPRAQVVRSFKGDVAALELDFFYYKLNYKNLTLKWVGPVLIRRGQLKSPQDARERARRYWEYGTPVLSSGGWHFSYMQNPAGIKLKLNSFSHQECNTPEFTDVEAIAHRIKYGLDLVGRTDHFWCCVPLDATFPAYLVQHPERFRDFIADFNEFHVNRQLLISRLYERLGKGNEDNALLLPSANVLLERERQISSLLNELAGNQNRLAQLQAEFDEKALWADRMDNELAVSRDQLARLQAEFDEKTRWAERLDAEVQTLRFLWSKATRWKRALVFFALAPVGWTIGCAVLFTELVARLLRRSRQQKAPLLPPADITRCSIIVPSWEGKELLSESLPALLKAVRVHGGDHEIIVVDNGSTDGTAEYVQAQFPGVRVVRSERNLFFSGGTNLGVESAKNDVVFLLNNDMIVDKDFLGPLLLGFQDPDIFAIASQVFLADARKFREETGKTRATFNGCDLDWAHDTISPSDAQRKYIPVFWGHGGAVALHRQKFLWLGGFDPHFDPFYVEDADLSYRAWKVGWRCLLAVESRVVHKHRGTIAPHFSPRFINQIIRRNQYLFIWKNFGDLGKLVEHFLRSPRTQIRRAGVPGVGIRLEAKAFLGAAERLAGLLIRKLRLARSVVRSDEEILRLISTPAAETIRGSEVDFRDGDCDEQLGEGWYPREQKNGAGFRWMSKKASVSLRVPAHASELCVTGYVPNSLLSDGADLSLTLSCNGKQKCFRLREGPFEQGWTTKLVPGAPARVELVVSRVHEGPADSRTLGIIIHRIALSARMPDEDKRQSQELHPPVSISNPLAPRGPQAGSQRRILMVCAYLPCQGIHGGGNMMFHLIRLLSKRHLLTVLAFYDRDEERELIPRLAPFCQQLEVIYRGRSLDASNLLGLKPPEIVNEFYHERMWRLVEKCVNTQKFDLIQCEYLQTAHFAEVDRSIPAVLTNHELLSFSYANRYRSVPWRSPRKKASALAAWMRMLNYEEKLLRRFAGVVVLTQAEQDYLARYNPRVKVYRQPMGVDSDFFCPGRQPSEKASVIFVGNFRHYPNVNGATWFSQQVWPRIRARNPAARLCIVGASPPPALLSFDGVDGVSVTGFVEDVRPYLQGAAVFVAPILDGAGLRTKVLEAWAMQKPVVGTRLAFEGITDQDGQVCRIAEDPETFADCVCELLTNPQLADQIGERARQFVVRSFSWEAFGDLYDRIYQQILEPPGSSVVRAAMAAGG